MKKSFQSPKKETMKRSSTIAKTNVSSRPNALLPEAYRYYVGPGNNPHLIRKVLSTRKQWQELPDSKNILLSLKWQQTNKGFTYESNSVKKTYRNMVNHCEYHQELSNKEYLFRNMLEYCELVKVNAFEWIPITFVLNTNDGGFQGQQTQFINFYYLLAPLLDRSKGKTKLSLIKKSLLSSTYGFQKKISTVTSKYEARECFVSPITKALWILKPTFNNRGNGIHVFNSLGELETQMNKYIRGTPEQPGLVQKEQVSPKKASIWNTNIVQSTSFVIQKYLEKPLLFDGRKFDLRIWVMLDHQMKVYMFKQGYIRTSSQQYSLGQDKMSDLGVHLTNNSVQIHSAEYNKYEKGNQLSFRALRMLLEGKGRSYEQFMERMKESVKMTFMSVRRRINRMDRDNSFEIFGYDYMIDEVEFKPWLIEVNTNPSLEESSPLLQQLLPRMLDDAFSLTLDKVFPSVKTEYNYTIDTQINGQNLWQMLLDLKNYEKKTKYPPTIILTVKTTQKIIFSYIIIPSQDQLQNSLIQAMSFVIQMLQYDRENQEEDIHLVLSQQINIMLQHPEFSQASICQSSQHGLVLGLRKGGNGFIRDTKWSVEIRSYQLRVWVSIFQFSGVCLLKAQSERMKLELMILLRFVNGKLPIQEEFFVEPQTGLLRYSFVILWKDFRQKIQGQEGMRKLFRYLISQLNMYAEVILFCEPKARENQVGQELYQKPKSLESINRYRFLMRGTRRFRESNMGIVEQALQIKGNLKRNPRDENGVRELDQLRVMFQSNIAAYEEMRVGLDDTDPKELASCLKHISKAGEGKESRQSESKIVSGIKILRQLDIRPLSNEGAHSEILKGKFVFKLYKTINEEVIQNEQQWTDGREHKSELILKSCNVSQQSSINSFMNEIDFLNQVRDNHSSYIAKYYLKIKRMENRDEMDYIYMRPYAMNLYGVVRRCKTFSLEERLVASYRISKGLCFLTSKSILHRDFKPHNIMMDQMLNPFIIDFGSCAPIFHDTTFRVHEERLLTTKMFHVYYHEIPEEFAFIRQKFTREEYNRHPLFDVYSFGRVLSFIFFDSLVPPGPDDVASRPYPELLKNVLYIVMLCLQLDPDQRPTFSEIQSFLGTLKGFISSLPEALEQRVRSLSEPRPVSNNL